MKKWMKNENKETKVVMKEEPVMKKDFGNLGRVSVAVDVDEVLYATAEYAKDLAKEEKGTRDISVYDLLPFFKSARFYEALPAKTGADAFIENLSMFADVYLVCRTPANMKECRFARILKDFDVEEDHILFPEDAPLKGYSIFVGPSVAESYCRMNIKFDCGWNENPAFEGIRAESFADILTVCGNAIFDNKKMKHRWV